MSNKDMDELAQWMATEQGESWDEADALFATLASRHLPMFQAPAGLSTRIMAAIPRTVAPPPIRAIFDFAASWWVRATVAAAVVVLGAALATVSSSQLLDAATGAIDGLARITTGLFGSLSAAVGLWGVSLTLLTNLGRAAMLVTTSGPAPALIAGSLSLACLSFLGLTRLLSPREECY